MARFLIIRLGLIVVTLFVVSMAIFATPRCYPATSRRTVRIGPLVLRASCAICCARPIRRR